MVLWCFLLCLMLVCTLVHSMLSAAKARKLPPGPFPFPIVGNLLQLGNMPHKSLTMLAKIHGPIMSLKLGQVTTIVISSAPMAKEILQKHDLHFSNRAVPDAITAHNHHKFSVAWLPPSNRWRNLRKISNTHVFAAQKLDANQHLRRKKIDELLAYVKQRCEESVAVDIGEAAFRTSLNLMSNTMFSTDLVSPNSDGAREFWDLISDMAKQLGKPNLADYFPVVRSIDPQGIRRKNTTSFGKFLGIFDKMIDERLQSRQTHNSAPGSDVLDTLLSISKNNEIDRNQILHLITDLFLGATHTTSSTLEWAMAEMLRNPKILSKAQAELDQVIGKDNPVNESDVPKLMYLQAIVKETFRLHPPVPFLLPRKADKDEEVWGFILPKDSRVLVNVWAIGRDPTTWAEPNLFRPERFLGSDIDVRGHDFELIPFGAGRRICPGLPLALRMVHLALASLIHSFNWEIDGDLDMSDTFGLAMQKAKPLLALPISI